MLRILIAGCLSLLLLGMQQQIVLHGLQHDGARIADDRAAGLHKAGGEGPCEWCALLAGGSHALTAVALDFPTASGPQGDIVARPARAFAAAPVYYSSRAPPLPL